MAFRDLGRQGVSAYYQIRVAGAPRCLCDFEGLRRRAMPFVTVGGQKAPAWPPMSSKLPSRFLDDAGRHKRTAATERKISCLITLGRLSRVRTASSTGRIRQQTRAFHWCDGPPEGATFLMRDIIRKETTMTATPTKPELDTAQNAQTPAIRPFRVEVPQADLDDLRQRIAATRWPTG